MSSVVCICDRDHDDSTSFVSSKFGGCRDGLALGFGHRQPISMPASHTRSIVTEEGADGRRKHANSTRVEINFPAASPIGADQQRIESASHAHHYFRVESRNK